MIIRNETPKDYKIVSATNASSFNTEAAANLVEELRQMEKPHISLVAEEDGFLIEHSLFIPINLRDRPELKLMCLELIVIFPEHQDQWTDSALIKAGLEQCKRSGFGACVVLGHKDYYPRFGFYPVCKLWNQVRVRCSARSIHGHRT